MSKNNLEKYRTNIEKKDGEIQKVKLDLYIENENHDHDMVFKPSPIEHEGSEKPVVKLEDHTVPLDYQESTTRGDGFDKVNLDDKALESVQIARQAAEEILEDNGIKWLKRQDKPKIGGKQQ